MKQSEILQRDGAGAAEGPFTEDFSRARPLCYRAAVGTKSKAVLRAFTMAMTAVVGTVLMASCTSTEFVREPAGQPTDRASGSVPPGALGVCKRAGTKRPPIVSEKLWEDTKPCTVKTPEQHIRIGYSDKEDPEAAQQIEQILTALRESQKEEGGNNRFVEMVRGVRQHALNVPSLRDKVQRDTTSAGACDFTYLLNTMGKTRMKLDDEKCTAEVYDPKARDEVCLFDEAAHAESLWLTGGWACLMNVRKMGTDQSCHRLCAYDDYCARQVSCAGADIDLLLCTMGVCLPDQKPF